MNCAPVNERHQQPSSESQYVSVPVSAGSVSIQKVIAASQAGPQE